jgi:hypothetical protein
VAGRLDQVLLPDVSLELVAAVPDHPSSQEAHVPTESFSSLNMVTVSDLVQGLPVLPFDQLQLGRLKIVRDQATGPLREVSVVGTVRQRGEGVLAELTFQGTGTQTYVLHVSDLATGVMSVQLGGQIPSSTQIFNWRSEAVAGEVQSQLRGTLDVNIHELAPFLALILPIGSEWQLVTGRIQASWTGTAASTTALASVWHDPHTRVLGTFRMDMSLPELKGIGEKLVIAVSTKFSGNPTQLSWSIDPGTMMGMDIETRKLVSVESFRAFMPAGIQTLRVESAQGVSGEIRWADSPPRMVAQGPLTLSYDAAKDPVHGELVLAHLALRGRLIETAEGIFEVVGALPATMSERLHLKRATGNIEGRLSVKEGDILGTILPSSSMTAVRFQHGSVSAARGTIHLSEALPWRFATGTGEWRAGPSTVVLRSPKIRLARQDLVFQQATVRMEGGGSSFTAWKGQGTAIIQGLTFRRSTSHSIPARMTIQFAADPAVIKADIQGEDQDRIVMLNAQTEHTFATGRGRFHGALGPANFDNSIARLRRLWIPWSFPVDITGGRVAATIDLAWQSERSGSSVAISGTEELVLENVSGRYGDFAFAGLNTNLHITTKSLDTMATTHPAEVKLASLSRGIEATDISLTLQAEGNIMMGPLPVVEVREVRWQLLGATMTSQGVRADLARPPYSFTVLARAMDLAKVLSLEQQKGLQGTGFLDGTIPVTVGARGVTVKDAYFEARPPGGVIQYHASPDAIKTMTDANTNMQLVLQALNNFHYNVLQVGAQYGEDGMLSLTARIEGRNPDSKKTPPVHFNLTVQENVPALLKSLRLVQDIEKSVENRFVRP